MYFQCGCEGEEGKDEEEVEVGKDEKREEKEDDKYWRGGVTVLNKLVRVGLDKEASK